MMTIVSPSATSRVKPSRTCFGSEGFVDVLSWIIDAAIGERGVGRAGRRRTRHDTDSRNVTCRQNTSRCQTRTLDARLAETQNGAARRGRPVPGIAAILVAGVDRSGREAAQRAADVAFAQALERAVAELANALARDAEHGADFLERVLASALEAEVEAQHLRVARRQRRRAPARSRR